MVGVLVGASLRGESAVFGEVLAVQSPREVSTCEYESVGPGEYRGRFDIFGWFALPRYGRVFRTTAPVRVAGTAAQIPPVGQVAEHVDSQVPLREFGEKGVDVGFVGNARGEVRALVKVDEALSSPAADSP